MREYDGGRWARGRKHGDTCCIKGLSQVIVSARCRTMGAHNMFVWPNARSKLGFGLVSPKWSLPIEVHTLKRHYGGRFPVDDEQAMCVGKQAMSHSFSPKSPSSILGL